MNRINGYTISFVEIILQSGCMSFDNVCKLLSEKYPERFATWVLGEPQTSVEILKTELSIEPIRADSVTFLQLQGTFGERSVESRILHLEFQVRLESNPPLSLRMVDYWVRLYRLYRLPVTQVVVLLLPPTEGTVIETAFVVENTRHEYQVIKLWQEDPERFLNEPALLPLAPLTATTQAEALLQRVAQRGILSCAQRSKMSLRARALQSLRLLHSVRNDILFF